MNGKSEGGTQYLKREVRDEYALITQQTMEDLGWTCTRREAVGEGKSALYFCARQERDGRLGLLQKECEGLLKEAERKRRGGVRLSFAALGAGIAAAYFLLSGMVAAFLGSFVFAGCLFGAGLAALLTAGLCAAAQTRVSDRLCPQLEDINRRLEQARLQARLVRSEERA